MNSKNLKKTYHHAYERFFMENNIVISTPFIMNWSGDVLNNYSGVGIKQKIPLRLYVGCSRNSSGKISLGKVYHLDLNEYNFIQTNALEYAPYFSDLNTYIEEKYSHLLSEYGGLEINILSELPRGVGLGFGSIIALLLAVLFNRLEHKIDANKLNELKKQNINELLNDTYGEFYNMFLDALDLDKHIYSMVSSGTKLASFFDSHYPIVSFAQDFDKASPHTDLQTNRYFGFRFQDVFKEVREVPYAPIDYGLIYSGKPVLLEQIAGRHYKNNAHIAKEIKSEFRTLFGDYLDHLAPKQRPRFYKYLISSEIDEFDLTYGKLMGIISLKLLYFMSKMYCDGYDESNMHQFLDAVRKLRQGDSVTRDSSYTFLSFIKILLERFQGSQKHLSLAPNDSTIMGGCLLFAMPLEGFRKSLIDATQAMSPEFASSKMIYANWIDGVECEGIKCEQDVRVGIYSEFLNTTNCILKRSNGKIMIGDCETSIANYKTGLLLDTVNNKIYLDGKKLTSQDIHSQSATIEIMKLLIENSGKDIANKDLPVSSYSKNKNEMLGKIVLPLIELIESRTGKKLPLICKGTIYDFYLKLNKSDIDIAVIDYMKKG